MSQSQYRKSNYSEIIPIAFQSRKRYLTFMEDKTISGLMQLRPEIRRLLGKISDGAIADRFGVTRPAVTLWRHRLGIDESPDSNGGRPVTKPSARKPRK